MYDRNLTKYAFTTHLLYILYKQWRNTSAK
jgi:hypothetical protein